MECGKAPKAKKKQVKDEMDRMKQAEKKKRRLEKALATSAAIRLELEKKKQKKKEEQQRLDEEGAAIAEAVALHVLLGEDSEDSNEVMPQKDLWDRGRRSAFPQHDLSFEGPKWISSGQSYMVSSEPPWGRVLQPQFLGTTSWDSTNSFAEAISSLQIAEDAPAGTYIFNRML